MNACPSCGTDVTGVEYAYNHPEHYDGISEWWCESCDRRWGRWTGRELFHGEVESRYGNRGVVTLSEVTA